MVFTFSRRVALATLSSTGLVTLAACSGSPEPPTPAVTPAEPSPAAADTWTTPRTMPAGKGSDAPDGSFPRTVKHFLGETTINAVPARVVVLATGQADAVITHGIVPVGATVALGAALVPDYLRRISPELASQIDAMEDLGARGEPNAEAIAALAPDLILMNATGDAKVDTYDRLSEIAPVVATQGTGLHWKEDFLLLSDALGRREAAEQWLDDYHAETAEWGDGVKGAPTISLVRRNGDRIRVFQVASFGGSVLEDAGLARPESQSATDATSVNISNEQLVMADGDWIFYGIQGGDATELTGLPVWDSLSAVKAERAVQVDDDPFYLNAGPAAARHVLDQLRSSLG